MTLVVIGTGGHSRVVAETAQLLNYHIAGFIDLNFSGIKETILGIPVLGGLETLMSLPSDFKYFVAVGDNSIRKQVFDDMVRKGNSPVTLIHPSAIISAEVKVGLGTIICAGCIINTKAQICENTIINTGSIIDHETVIESDSHIAPGCKIAGRTKIGKQSFVGIGATIIDQIELGESVIVGAGSVIISDVPANSKIVGVPGKILQ